MAGDSAIGPNSRLASFAPARPPETGILAFVKSNVRNVTKEIAVCTTAGAAFGAAIGGSAAAIAFEAAATTATDHTDAWSLAALGAGVGMGIGAPIGFGYGILNVMRAYRTESATQQRAREAAGINNPVATVTGEMEMSQVSCGDVDGDERTSDTEALVV